MSYDGKKNTDKWFPVLLVDDTDMKTPETGIAFGSVTAKYEYEAATSQSTYSVTTDDWKESGNGEYWLRIGASEFTVVGKYFISVAASGCLTHRFVVEVTTQGVETAYQNTSSNASDLGTLLTRISSSISISNGRVDADVLRVNGNAAPIANWEDDYDGTGYNKSNSTIGTCTANSDMRGTDNGLLAASAPANFGDLAITATTGRVTAGTVLDKTGYTLTSGEQDAIVDKVWDEAQAGHTTGGTFGKRLDADVSTRSTFDYTANNVTVQTNNDKSGYALSGTSEDSIVDKVWDELRASHTTAGTFGQGVASVQGNVTGSVGSVTGAVGSVTAGVTVTTNNDKSGYTLTSGEQDAIVDKVWDELRSAHTSAGSFGQGVASVQGNVTGNVSGSVGSVTGNVGGNVSGSVGSVTSPVTVGTNNDKTGYALSSASEDAIADAVWDEARSGHTTGGTFGEGVASVQGNVTGSVGSVTAGVTVTTNNDKSGYALSTTSIDAVVDAVWDELQSGHTTAGTFGKYLDIEVSTGSGSGITAQQVRDAMKLAPTGGAPAAGSIDEHLDDILADTNEIQGKLPTNEIMGSSDKANNDTVIDAIKAVTDNLPNSGALTDIDTGINNIEAKLPTKSTIAGTNNADGDIELNDATGALATGAYTNLPDVTVEDFTTAAKNLINAEVVDVIFVDTVPEITQGTPPTVESVAAMLSRLRGAQVFKGTQTKGGSASKDYYNSSGTRIWRKNVSDDDTTYVEEKGITGA